MTRPPVVPEIRLLGIVVVKRRGGVWMAGEVYPRVRAGQPGEETARPSYCASPGEALSRALERADALVRVLGAPEGSEELLGALAEAVPVPTGPALDRPGELLLEARVAAGLSKRGLAARARCSRTTIREIEAGRQDPHLSTLLRLLAACEGAT